LKGLEAACEHVVSQNEKLVLVATGPLTNVALFFSSFPELSRLAIEECVLMGGAVEEQGNSNDERTAEWCGFPRRSNVLANILRKGTYICESILQSDWVILVHILHTGIPKLHVCAVSPNV